MKKNILIYTSLVIPLIILIVSLFFIIKYTNKNKEKLIEYKKNSLREDLLWKKSDIEGSLYKRLYIAKDLANTASRSIDISNEKFAEQSKKLFDEYPSTLTVAYSPNFIISYVYPLKGHESILGLDLKSNHSKRFLVDKVLETKNTYISDPIKLIEGDVAILCYIPILNKDETKIVGLYSMTIIPNDFLNSLNINTIGNEYTYAIRDREKTKVFWGDASIFDKNPISIEINFPSNKWEIAACPKHGWDEYTSAIDKTKYILIITAFFVCILLWLLFYSAYKNNQSAKELKAIFLASSSIIFRCNRSGVLTFVASNNNQDLLFPADQLIGKKVQDLLSKHDAELFLYKLYECYKTKDVVSFEYCLTINKTLSWFSARLSYFHDDAYIFNANNITSKKEAEFALERSKFKLAELNSMKNRMLSIIGHDLRNPIGTQRELLKNIIENYDNLNDETRKEMLTLLSENSINTFNLLVNLVTWSKSQQNAVNINSRQQDIYPVVQEVLQNIKATATVKNITIVNNTSPNISAFFDIDIIKTILRNLISNAIKYTQPDNNILISDEVNDNYIIIHVKDEGVGMTKDLANRVFSVNKGSSVKGTNNEEGTGLGLILCQELVSKQNGEIWVNSTIGKGSTFSFSIPLQK